MQGNEPPEERPELRSDHDPILNQLRRVIGSFYERGQLIPTLTLREWQPDQPKNTTPVWGSNTYLTERQNMLIYL